MEGRTGGKKEGMGRGRDAAAGAPLSPLGRPLAAKKRSEVSSAAAPIDSESRGLVQMGGGGAPPAALAHWEGSGGVVSDATSPPGDTQLTRHGAPPSEAVRLEAKGVLMGARSSRCVACEMV